MENLTQMRSIINDWETQTTLEGYIENHSDEKIHTTFFQTLCVCHHGCVVISFIKLSEKYNMCRF